MTTTKNIYISYPAGHPVSCGCADCRAVMNAEYSVCGDPHCYRGCQRIIVLRP